MALKVINTNGNSTASTCIHTYSSDGAGSQADGEVKAFCAIGLQRATEAEQGR